VATDQRSVIVVVCVVRCKVKLGFIVVIFIVVV
jgi:hypothetical protein